MSNTFLFYLLLVVFAQPSCSSKTVSSLSKEDSLIILNKIELDISQIDENGMIGPEDGKRNVAYEFCIPIDSKKRNEVAFIDSSVHFFKGPKGRIGCGEDQYLCIGDGGTKDVLFRLAQLNYINRILPFYGE